MSKVTKQDISKVIMPNKCDICTIGIGTSMFYFENTWRKHKHIEEKVIPYYWSGGKINICSECNKELKKMKKPNQYITNQFIKVKVR